MSFPAKWLLKRKLFIGDVLDYGCGLGKDVEELRKSGINIVGYDPHYFPELPTQRFDTIFCSYVLNVLLPEEQASTLIHASRLLKPTGRTYFIVRRDIVFEGYRTHRIHQKPTYQCLVNLPFKSVFKNKSCEIYEYKPFNMVGNGVHSECPFCYPKSSIELIAESATTYAIFDKYPVSQGHALIIPKRHTVSYFDLSFKAQSACWFVLNEVKTVIQEEYNPDGFNVGINITEVAGQSVPHAHIHLIPRYSGDDPDPRGGIRGVTPNKKSY